MVLIRTCIVILGLGMWLGGCMRSRPPTPTAPAPALVTFGPLPGPRVPAAETPPSTSAAQDCAGQACIRWWQDNYKAHLASASPKFTWVQEVFIRVREVTGLSFGMPSGRRPELYITEDPAVSIPALALQDGSIVLSTRALEICREVPELQKDRLAFVLAHELAHLLTSDFRHLRLFAALHAGTPGILPAEAWQLEYDADARAILTLSLSGFRPHAIVDADRNVNFFREWVQALDPQAGHGRPLPSHPTPEDRAREVLKRLRQVSNHVDVFQLGVQSYQAGASRRALEAFTQFNGVYPSREAAYNVAVSHHQLALLTYHHWQQKRPLPFHLLVSLDPETLASREGGLTHPADDFREHLDQALRFYALALDRDPTYTPAVLSLAGAYLLQGAVFQRTGPAHKAIGLLQELSQGQQSWRVLNTLGVAWWYAEPQRPEHARALLVQALDLARQTGDPLASAPVLDNLGELARQTGRPDEAAAYGQAARQVLGGDKSPAAPCRHRGRACETLGQMHVGMLPRSVPPTLPPPQYVRSVQLPASRFTVAEYDAGVQRVTDSQQGDIVYLATLEKFTGASARGIRLGDSSAKVLDIYKHPTRIVPLPQGMSLVYEDARIAFQVRAAQVVSWLLF